MVKVFFVDDDLGVGGGLRVSDLSEKWEEEGREGRGAVVGCRRSLPQRSMINELGHVRDTLTIQHCTLHVHNKMYPYSG